jgi:hypothetical protein
MLLSPLHSPAVRIVEARRRSNPAWGRDAEAAEQSDHHQRPDQTADDQDQPDQAAEAVGSRPLRSSADCQAL